MLKATISYNLATDTNERGSDTNKQKSELKNIRKEYEGFCIPIFYRRGQENEWEVYSMRRKQRRRRRSGKMRRSHYARTTLDKCGQISGPESVEHKQRHGAVKEGSVWLC
ncbi:hypothetical protein SKAU_G00394310 [Synaphobranchus kaupii]|uniref:Uncharacterized protein n=1 Tax=Synaphobranchus kaupii TaxID=118154 RepID=A0A9Q1IBW9_SYNKA|nr:hypothetical protein SKAU_G00394310 [Synaphobranchus kaupii]